MKEKKKDGRKIAYLVGLCVLLAVAIFVNYRLSATEDEAITATEVEAPFATPAPELVQTDTTEYDFFDSFREERDVMRTLEIEYLDEIIAISASDAETLAEAQAQKLSLVTNMESEFVIESMLLAKGFLDAAVTVQGGSVNVVIDCDTLNTSQVAQILDIVTDATGQPAENVKIISNK